MSLFRLFPSKCCTTCEVRRPLSHFLADTRKPDGHHNTCKDCVNARRRANRAEAQRRDAQRRQKAVVQKQLASDLPPYKKLSSRMRKALKAPKEPWQKPITPTEVVAESLPQKVAIESDRDDIETLQDALAEKYPVFQSFTFNPRKHLFRLQVFRSPLPLCVEASDLRSLLQQAMKA